jgi:hypothetical protein
LCEREEAVSRFFIHPYNLAGARGEQIQLVVDVWLDILAPIGEARQAKRPQVDPGEQILAEPTIQNIRRQVAVRSR